MARPTTSSDVPRLVSVRGVPEGDPEFDCLLEERLRLIVVERPPVCAGGVRVAVAHATQRETADLQPGVAQAGVLHGSPGPFGPASAALVSCRAIYPSEGHERKRAISLRQRLMTPSVATKRSSG